MLPYTSTSLLLSVVIGYSAVACKMIFVEESAPSKDEIIYMKRYGYLPEKQPDDEFAYTLLSTAPAVQTMQRYGGLPQTGVIDTETKKLLSKRRCGVKDIEDKSTTSRRKRYIIQQGWKNKDITYRVANGSSTLEKARVEAIMAAGLAVWAPYGNLRFVPVRSGGADIRVSFVSTDHGDGFPFDGPGHVVAHAFPPPHGAMHFDDDEMWGENPDEDDDDVTDFFAVAVHEIGHALGMSHSDVKESVMFPYYQVPVEKLHEDDILGMHELYLKEEDAAPESDTEGPAWARSSLAPHFTKAAGDDDDGELPDLCFANYDTIQVIQGKIFVFEEEWLWVLSERKVVDDGYPKRFHDVFVGLPKHIQAIKTIYEKLNGHIIVFSKRSYWEFSSRFRLITRGRLTEYMIPPQVSELTTVFISNYNNKTYLIEYEKFWRFDEATWTMDKGYPKEMSAWRQVPYPVDAAIIWKGDTFFFRGPRFWRFDNEQVQAHQNYPLPTAPVWLPCLADVDVARYLTDDER